jgi:phage recombination protein Bet
MNVPAIKPPAIDLELVRNTVAKGATPEELQLFLYDCQRRGVHPLDKLIHFTKRAGRYVPVTSIDLMRSRAAESGELAGSDDAIFVETDGRYPESASVTVYRITQGSRYAYTATARWAEYAANADMWKRMPHTMLAKCAEALALRKGFPQQLAGLYAREELDQAEVEENGRASSKRPPKPAQNPMVRAVPEEERSPVANVAASTEPPDEGAPTPETVAPQEITAGVGSAGSHAPARDETIRLSAREAAMQGRSQLVDYYTSLSAEERRIVAAMTKELTDLYPPEDRPPERIVPRHQPARR